MYLEKMVTELEKKGVKKKDIPDKLDISYGSVLNYFSKKRVMPINVFFEIMRVFELDICCVLDCSAHNPNFVNYKESETDINKIAELEKKIFELEIRLDECRQSSVKK